MVRGWRLSLIIMLLALSPGIATAAKRGFLDRCRAIFTTPASVDGFSEEQNIFFMRQAILEAQHASGAPFGSVLVDRRTGKILAVGGNETNGDPTFHAEIVALRAAAQNRDILWPDVVLYSTAEPCPMCMSAAEWAGICAVYYGTSIPYLREQGFLQIDIRASEVDRRTPFRSIQVRGGLLEDECNLLYYRKRLTPFISPNK